jgi:hypothetical protein
MSRFGLFAIDMEDPHFYYSNDHFNSTEDTLRLPRLLPKEDAP